MILTLLQSQTANLTDPTSILATYQNIINALQSSLLVYVISFGRGIAMFGVLFTLLLHYQQSLASGHPFDFKKLYPLFIIFFALLLYSQVTFMFDNLGIFLQGMIDKGFQKVGANASGVEFSNKLQGSMNSFSAKAGIDTSYAPSAAAQLSTSTTAAKTSDASVSIWNLSKWLNQFVLGLVGGICLAVVALVSLLYNILFSMKKIILSIFGPFSIGLSAVPIYRNSGLNWMNTYFVTVIAQAIANIFLLLYKAVVFTLFNKMPDTFDIGGLIVMAIMLVALGIITIYIIKDSDKMAAKFMALNTSGSVSVAAGDAMKGAAGLAKKFIGA